MSSIQVLLLIISVLIFIGAMLVFGALAKKKNMEAVGEDEGGDAKHAIDRTYYANAYYGEVHAYAVCRCGFKTHDESQSITRMEIRKHIKGERQKAYKLALNEKGDRAW